MQQRRTHSGKLRRPVTVDPNHLPAGIGSAEDIGRAQAAAAAADHVEVDDGVFPIVCELGEGEAEDEVVRGAVAAGRVKIENRVGLSAGDTDGFGKGILLPVVGKAGEVDFPGELVEGADRYGFEEVMVCPFVVIVSHEAAGVGTGDEEIVRSRAVDDCRKDGVDETLGGWESGDARGRRRLRADTSKQEKKKAYECITHGAIFRKIKLRLP
jgi:hypothetical protein